MQQNKTLLNNIKKMMARAIIFLCIDNRVITPEEHL